MYFPFLFNNNKKILLRIPLRRRKNFSYFKNNDLKTKKFMRGGKKKLFDNTFKREKDNVPRGLLYKQEHKKIAFIFPKNVFSFYLSFFKKSTMSVKNMHFPSVSIMGKANALLRYTKFTFR